MRYLRRYSSLVGLVAGSALLAFQSCKQARIAPEAPPLPVFAPVKAPAIRVGIGIDLQGAEITALGSVRLYEGLQASELIAETDGRVIADLSAESIMRGIETRYAVQVGSFANPADAEAFAGQVSKDASMRAVVVSGRTAGKQSQTDEPLHPVRLGPFTDRRAAAAAIEFLSTRGYPDAFIVEEKSELKPSRTFKLAFKGGYRENVRDGCLYVVPVGEEPGVEFGGKRYRGLLQVRLNDAARLTIINVVNIEDYLRGVVPNELSPASFPQIEALKAQAVAARTYALKNLGQFGDYDICATPMCQVYEGASSETEMSDRAVAETEGEVAVFGGQLINALYTSTCGGSTEFSEKMFQGKGAPYLRPVTCYPETVTEYVLETSGEVVEDAGAYRRRMLDLLGVARTTPEDESADADPKDTAAWANAAMKAAHRKTSGGESGHAPVQIGPFATYLIEQVGWNERLERLFEQRDADMILAPYEDQGEIEAADRPALAYLVVENIIRPVSPLRLGAQPALSRGRVADILFKLILAADDPRRSGRFVASGSSWIEIEADAKTTRHDLAPALQVFRSSEQSMPVPRAVLFGGEMLRYSVDDEGRVAIVSVPSPEGLGSDRTSRYYRWEARASAGELQAKIARSYPIGDLIDIEVAALGESGRVVELLVRGSENTITLQGIKIRWALGLRDNLFVFDRMYDAEGRIAAYQFSGKGWGHGVGLCQVGSYGMALRGLKYRDILKTYYTGIDVVKR